MSATAFTFCTVQYESGDWDSAPLLPANLRTLRRSSSVNRTGRWPVSHTNG